MIQTQNILDIIRELETLRYRLRLTQSDIANYLSITRQSYAKLVNQNYIKLSTKTKYRINQLLTDGELDIKKAEEVIKYYQTLEYTLKTIGDLDDKEIQHYTNIIKYVNYWNNESMRKQKYMEKIDAHIQNFHMRANPYYLYFHMFFHKDLQPVLTFQINYQENLVENVCLDSIVQTDYNHKGYDLNYQNNWEKSFTKKTFTFEEFIKSLSSFYQGKLKYIVYLDHFDNEFDYILENIKPKYKKIFNNLSFLDVSRLFQVSLNNKQSIENVISNYIEIDNDRLLKDAQYRNNQIIKLVKMIAGYNYSSRDESILDFLKTNDSEQFTKGNQILQEIIERRKKKTKI